MDVCDVVVVGGGIAGASVAYELAGTRSVILLEAEPELARHSTARSAATWIPGHGNDVVRALIAASGPRFARLSDELDAPPLLRPMDVLWVAFDQPSEIALSAMLAERKGEPDAPVALTPAEAEECCPTLRPGRLRAAARTGAAAVDTAALHQAYVRGLRRAAAGPDRARAVDHPRRDGLAGPATATREVLHTGAVVDAAGAWADVVAELRACPASASPRCGGRSRSPGCPTRPASRPRTGACCRWSARPPTAATSRPTATNLLVSPADETPTEPGDARPDELDVALALERVEEATGLGPALDRDELGRPALLRPRPLPGRGGLARPPRVLVRRRAGRLGHRDRARAVRPRRGR